jgi:hypothetical protein
VRIERKRERKTES